MEKCLFFIRFEYFPFFFISFITNSHYLFSESFYKNPKVRTKTASCLDNLRYFILVFVYNKHLAIFRNLRKPFLIIFKLTNEKLSPMLSPSKGDYPVCKKLFKVRKICLGLRSTNVILLLLNRFLPAG